MAEDAIHRARRLEDTLRQLPQIELETLHTIHGGIYSRTIVIPAGTVMTGVLIKVPTTLVVSGHASIFIGSGVVTVDGYRVLTAGAGRKQVFAAHGDTSLTMLFPTSATTVEQAEHEFTDEVELLASRRESNHNIIRITGE